MADEPFCPDEKYSSTSLISVLCRLRISTASRSIEEAIIDRHENHEACLSRGITCVEIVSGFSPIFEATYVSTEGSIFAIERPIVPLFLTCGSPIPSAKEASEGIVFLISFELVSELRAHVLLLTSLFQKLKLRMRHE